MCWVTTRCSGCRFMASQPDKWDYTLAGVPSPLTDELESQQLAKQVICCSIPLRHPIVQCTVGWGTCSTTSLCYLQSQLGHLLQHLFVLLAVIQNNCCSTFCATCDYLGHLLQHLFVLFTVKLTFACIYKLQLLAQLPIRLCCLWSTASLLVSVSDLPLGTSVDLC